MCIQREKPFLRHIHHPQKAGDVLRIHSDTPEHSETKLETKDLEVICELAGDLQEQDDDGGRGGEGDQIRRPGGGRTCMWIARASAQDLSLIPISEPTRPY